VSNGSNGQIETGWIEIYQDRLWVGRPSQAIFNVYVDKKSVGKVPLRSSLTVPVSPGTHRVRIRQWYFGSNPLEVKVSPGQVSTYRADVPRGEGLRGFSRMLFNPTRCLAMTKTDEHSSAGDTPLTSNTPSVAPLGRPEDAYIGREQERVRRSGAVAGLVAVAGFILILIGLSTMWTVVVIGSVVVVAGLGWNIRTIVLARRLRHGS
jgi:hypothetical protein